MKKISEVFAEKMECGYCTHSYTYEWDGRRIKGLKKLCDGKDANKINNVYCELDQCPFEEDEIYKNCNYQKTRRKEKSKDNGPEIDFGIIVKMYCNREINIFEVEKLARMNKTAFYKLKKARYPEARRPRGDAIKKPHNYEKLIEEYIDGQISEVEVLSKRLGMNIPKLYRCVKQDYGNTLGKMRDDRTKEKKAKYLAMKEKLRTEREIK